MFDGGTQLIRVIHEAKILRAESVAIWARDGSKRDILIVDNMDKIGWVPAISPEQGVRLTYESFMKSQLETA